MQLFFTVLTSKYTFPTSAVPTYETWPTPSTQRGVTFFRQLKRITQLKMHNCLAKIDFLAPKFQRSRKLHRYIKDF